MGCERPWFSLCVLFALCGEASSAPPTLTSLFPAGGQRGSTVDVTVNGSFDAWPVKAWASDTAVSVTAGKEKGKLGVVVGKDAIPGVCWVRLFDDTGASQLRPFIVGVLPEVPEAEPNDTPAKPQAVEPGVVVNGKLGKTGDVDCFAVKLKKGQTLVAAVEANHTLRAPIDAVLQVASADGNVIEQNHDHRGLDPQLAYTATRDGTCLVRLFAFPSQPDSSIRHFGSDGCIYRLTLTTGGVIDFATPLAVERGKDAALTLHGWNLSEPTWKLKATEGRFHPAWSATGGAVVREPHPCFDFTNATPTEPLTPPVTVTGRLSKPGDVSRLTVTGSKGKPLAIRLDVASIGSPLTPVLRVADDAKKRLLSAEPSALNADLDTTLTPPADGPLAFEVRDLYGDGSARHFYRLRVTPASPGFDPQLATDRFTLTPGQPLDVPVTLNPKNGFAAELVWVVDGLPAGVTVTPVPATGKPDPKQATLRFETKSTAAVQTPIRIRAKPKDSPTEAKEVTVKLDGYDVASPDLWLSIARPVASK